MSSSISQSVRVGLFMAVALLLLALLIFRVEDWSPFREKGMRINAVFESVVGLDDKSAVRVAGVRVGKVDGIALDADGRRARVTLEIERKLLLTEGALAKIANQGLLGDKFVEIIPGPPGAPQLAEGAEIPGRTAVGFDQAMEQLSEIGESMKTALGGEDGAGFGPLVDSLKATADELRAVIAENRDALGGTVRNFERFSATLAEDLPRLTAQIERVLAQVDGVVAENRTNLRDGIAGIKELATSVQRSVDNLNQITDKIARGEGTVGKLINSDEAHTELMGALSSVEKGVEALGNTLGRVDRLKLDVGLETAYLADAEESRSALRVDLLPRGAESPRTFRFELVADPYGRVSEKEESVTVVNPDGSTETTTTTRLFRDQRRNEYSALVGIPFAARRGNVWAGLIENTGGVAVDYGVVPDKLSLSFEAYDFARELELDPHLRLTARWFPWRNVFVNAGYDDPLVDELASPFVGAGLRWSDDDLKYLLGSIPSF